MKGIIKKAALLSLVVYTTHKATLHFEKKRIKNILEGVESKYSKYRKSHG